MAFASFGGQQQVVTLLQRSLERGRLAHAYLFTGDQLEELEAVARTLAKTLNCQNPPNRAANGVPVDCCDQCVNCRKVQEGNHADVKWLRPESKTRIISVEQVRELIQTVNLKPTEAEYKIGVLIAADRLNVQAANAFLKTLEEPPKKSVIILLSTEPDRLLDTILSRCIRLTFATGAQKFSAAQLDWLDAFATTVSEAQGGLLARYRLLGTLLKQLSASKDTIEEQLTARSPLNRYTDVEADLKDKWEDELKAAIEAEYRRQRSEMLNALQWWLRDVWLQTVTAGDELLTFPQHQSITGAIADKLQPTDALANLTHLERLQRLLFTNVQEALALEVGLLKLKL
jgi:DNA polymerase III subunit delta'